MRFLDDLRFAARLLLKSRTFTITAVAALALGIGANTAIFSVLDGVVLRPLPYPQPDRLMTLWEVNRDGRPIDVSGANVRDWREAAESFSGLASYAAGTSTVLGGELPVRTRIAAVDRGFLGLIGVAPVAGRALASSEPGSPEVVVSEGFRRRYLGGGSSGGGPADDDPGAALGRTLEVYGQTLTVVGVMPAELSYPDDAQLWFPLDLFPDNSARSAHNYQVIARLAPGVSVTRARAEMATVFEAIEATFPEENTGAGIAVIPLAEHIAGPVKPALYALLASVGLVLLIACANVAGLVLVRASGRARELAVRSALGAGRWSTVRQLLAESLLLAAAGGVLGVALAGWSVEALLALAPDDLPRIDQVAIDGRILLFTLALSAVTALLCGLLPALRSTPGDLAGTLRADERGGGGRGRRGRALLVAAELALALVLLAGSGLLVRSFQQLLAEEPGFDHRGVLTVELALPAGSYGGEGGGQAVTAYYDQALDRLSALPGVERVAAVNNPPLAGRNINGTFFAADSPDEKRYHGYRVVSPGYFEALSIPLLAGRTFELADRDGSQPVAVINRSLAEATWPGEPAVGKRLRIIGMDSHGEEWLTVVGVVGDVRHRGLHLPPQPEAYLSYRQRPERASALTLLAIADDRLDPGTLAPAVRRALTAQDSQVPLRLEPMAELLAASLARRRFAMLLISLFAGVALLLAAVGLYGAMASLVDRRRREIGVRMALGAQRSGVLRLVFKEGMTITAGGVVAGLVAALLASRLLAGMLYRVPAADPVTYALVAALLTLVALAACLVPARRAAAVEPAEVLKES